MNLEHKYIVRTAYKVSVSTKTLRNMFMFLYVNSSEPPTQDKACLEYTFLHSVSVYYYLLNIILKKLGVVWRCSLLYVLFLLM